VEAFEAMVKSQPDVLFERLHVQTSLDPDREKLRIP